MIERILGVCLVIIAIAVTVVIVFAVGVVIGQELGWVDD